MLSVAACGSTIKAPAQNGVKFADAVAQASMVYVQVSWKGWVILPNDLYTSSNTYMPKGTYGPYTGVTSCSGFVASAAGDIVTAGHCVDGNSTFGGKEVIISAMLQDWRTANGKPLTAAQAAKRAALLAANARIEGSESGSPVNRTVRVTVPAVSSASHPANVVDLQPFQQGDVALLRATAVTAPALPVAQGTSQNGDSVVAAGYPGDVAALVDSGTPASFMEGTVSGTQTVNGTPFTEISSHTSPGMSGGPVLNMAGQVVGTVSWSPNGATAANFMTDTGSIRSILAGNGVKTTLTQADRAFRQGLAYYFARRYHEAVTQFNRALALQPGLTSATQYRQQAVAAYPNDVNPPSKGTPLWVYVAIGAGVLVLAGGVGAFLLLRRRRPGPSGAQPVMPVAGPAAPAPPASPAPAPPATAPTVTTPAATTPAATTPTAPVPPMTAPPMTAPPVTVPPAAVPPAGAGAAPQPPPGAASLAGADQERHFCPNCGQEHAKEAHYCEHCGQPFPGGFPAGHDTGGGIRA